MFIAFWVIKKEKTMNQLLLNIMNFVSGYSRFGFLGKREAQEIIDNTSTSGGSSSSGTTSKPSSSSSSGKQDLSDVAEKIVTVIEKVMGPILTVIGVLAVVYAVYLGVQYAKAEDADARKKVQGRLIGALIGAVIIVAGAVLCFAIKWDSVFKGLFKDTTGKDFDA